MGFFDKLFGKETPKGGKLSYYECMKYMKGALYYKDFQNALHHCELAIKCNTINPEPYLFQGDILMHMGNANEAIEAWNKALDLSKDKPEYKEIAQWARERKALYVLTLIEMNKKFK